MVHPSLFVVFASWMLVHAAGCAETQTLCPPGFELNADGTECVTIRCEGGTVRDGECVCPDRTDLVDGTCTDSACIGVDCGDGNECTTDSCANGSCTNTNVSNGMACDGGDGACTDGSCEPTGAGGMGGAGGAGGSAGGEGGMGGTGATCVDEGQACGSDTGECVAGIVECDGTTSLCTGEVGPIDEICDGLDNNCNGYIDEGLGEISPDALGGGFGSVAEMEAIADNFAVLARVNGSDSLYKFTSTGALAGAVAIGDGDSFGPDMVPLDGEDVLLTRGLPNVVAVVEARRASFAGVNPVLLGNWLTVKDTGLSALGVGTRPVRTDSSHVAVVFALATLGDSRNPGAVRFVDTPALPVSADEPFPSNADNVVEMDLVAPSDPDAPLIFAYKKGGEIRLVQVDRNDLGSGIDLPVATGGSPHLAASTDDKVALVFKSSTDRLSLVVFNAKTLECVSSAGQSPSSCVTDTGAIAVIVTDLVFNGQHWFAGFGTPSGWGLRGLGDDGVEVASHTDSSAVATSGVVLASKGDGSVMVASNVGNDGGAFETRIFECN